MQNVKSTLAMQLAHKINKAFPKMTFASALKYAWKQVNKSTHVAKRLVTGDYKITVKARKTMLGTVNDIAFIAKGIKASVKRLFSDSQDYVISLWNGW